MSKFSVIFVAAVISVVIADPNLYNQGQLNQFHIQPNFNPNENQPPIGWNQYPEEGNNGVISYPNHPQEDWNKYPNNNINNNGFDSHYNGPPNQWNNYPNGGNNNGFNSYPNQHPNPGNNYPNGGNHHHGPDHGPGNDKNRDCGPTIAWKDVPGMQWWCRANCFHIPSFCPSSHCRCW